MPRHARGKLLTIAEAAELVGLSQSAVCNAIDRRRLPHKKVRVVRVVRKVRRKDIIDYFARTKGQAHRPRSTAIET